MAVPAWKIAADVAEGLLTLNPVLLKRYEPGELNALSAELDRVARDTRATVVPQDDNEGAQKRNRKLLRISQAVTVLSTFKLRGR